jgi:hypothetical protein
MTNIKNKCTRWFPYGFWSLFFSLEVLLGAIAILYSIQVLEVDLPTAIIHSLRRPPHATHATPPPLALRLSHLFSPDSRYLSDLRGPLRCPGMVPNGAAGWSRPIGRPQ